MKELLALAGIALVGLTVPTSQRPTGSWHLHVVVLNGDTIHLATDSSYCITYNLRRQGAALKTKVDSAAVIEHALIRFHENQKTMIHLLNDSDLIMTKVRSGGRTYPNELDTGVFEMRHDTVVFTIRSRNGYQFALVHDPVREVLHFTDGIPSHMVYQEYKKQR